MDPVRRAIKHGGRRRSRRRSGPLPPAIDRAMPRPRNVSLRTRAAPDRLTRGSNSPPGRRYCARSREKRTGAETRAPFTMPGSVERDWAHSAHSVPQRLQIVTIASIRLNSVLKAPGRPAFVTHRAEFLISPPRSRLEDSPMPLYSLDGRRPALPPEGRYWIAPSACLIGDVSVEIEVGISFGAVFRGDNEAIVVGARTNIQESCTLHTDMGYPLIIGDDCTIGHNAILHGCAIGEGSLVGMGAVVLERGEDRAGMPGWGAGAGDGGQGIRRPFAHHRFARQGGPHARPGGDRGPSPLPRGNTWKIGAASRRD